MTTTIKDALKQWEAQHGAKAVEAEQVQLYGQLPPIAKMDASLSTLKKCVQLSLSSNMIEKITSLSGMDSLKILSLGRNQIKKIENLDGVADTLEQLWMSYNFVEKLAGIEKLKNLRVSPASFGGMSVHPPLPVRFSSPHLTSPLPFSPYLLHLLSASGKRRGKLWTKVDRVGGGGGRWGL
uniref:Dynein axonemal light chain 1 n=1 Tax=Palpitomonas bilix TaxID=652834 RepID=A0A7S3G9H5_9EUKA|mmetsp:Transcript_41366/g.107151  ORF Transcript_41366/g.107151 Transcript_41366/m.107151 type:complete len:181 (+) Transcript_41366:273-815(+)